MDVEENCDEIIAEKPKKSFLSESEEGRNSDEEIRISGGETSEESDVEFDRKKKDNYMDDELQEEEVVARQDRNEESDSENAIYKQDLDLIEEEDIQEKLKKIPIKKKKNNKTEYEPIPFAEKASLSEDLEVKLLDVPERLQLRLKGLAPLNAETLNEEVAFIADNLSSTKSRRSASALLLRKVKLVLEFLNKHKLEVMAIYVNKKHEIEPELTLKDLWEIYSLDVDFRKMSAEKTQHQIKLRELSNGKQRIKSQFKYPTKAEDLAIFTKYMREYISYQEGKNEEVKEGKLSMVQEVIIFGIDSLAGHTGITPDELAENLEREHDHLKMAELNYPKFADIPVSDIVEIYVKPSSRFCSESYKILQTLCRYMANELFYHPAIRLWSRKIYMSNVLLSTEPTILGKDGINANSQYYPVKRIVKRPINKIQDETWLMILECESKKLINVKFNMNWNEDSKDERKDFITITDGLFVRLFKVYGSKENEGWDSIQKGVNKDWNVVRGEVIRTFLNELLYKQLELELREELFEMAEKRVLKVVSKKLRAILNTAPIYCESEENNDKKMKCKIVSLVYEQKSKSTIVVSVDENGVFKEGRELKRLIIQGTEKKNPELERESLQEKKALEEFILDYRPNVITVGANCMEAVKLKRLADNIAEDIRVLRQEKAQNVVLPRVMYVDCSVPQLIAKNPRVSSLFPKENAKFIEAISLARFIQNPLAETLNLWSPHSTENGIKHIPFHPYQNMVRASSFKTEIEKCCLEVVNFVGLELNEILEHPHLMGQLEFVCGLGRRKAQFLIEKIRKENRNVLSSREELKAKKFVDNIVYSNCAGFLKIQTERGNVASSGRNPLDCTRIHPEIYSMAHRIARAAVVDEDEENSDFEIDKSLTDNDYVTRAMNQSFMLKGLDLEEYARNFQNKHVNYSNLFKFIVKELENPFKDPRKKPYELSNKELFYLLAQENMHIFIENYVVNIVVQKIFQQNITCKISDNKLQGVVYKKDIFERNEMAEEISSFLSEGQSLQARIKKIDYDNFRVELTVRSTDLKTQMHHLTALFPHWKENESTFKIMEEEDFLKVGEQLRKVMKFAPKNISHPKFKNITLQHAEDYLKELNNGEYVFRPSSKGPQNLVLTWKTFENIIMNMEVKEEKKMLNGQKNFRLRMDKEDFASLDEIIEKFIDPINLIISNITIHKRFLNGKIKDLESSLLNSKEKSPKEIPYLFSSVEEAPLHILFLYYHESIFVKEYIHIRQQGLFFHNSFYDNLQTLVQWFKSNWKTFAYLEYRRKAKPPFLDLDDAVVISDDDVIALESLNKKPERNVALNREDDVHLEPNNDGGNSWGNNKNSWGANNARKSDWSGDAKGGNDPWGTNESRKANWDGNNSNRNDRGSENSARKSDWGGARDDQADNGDNWGGKRESFGGNRDFRGGNRNFRGGNRDDRAGKRDDWTKSDNKPWAGGPGGDDQNEGGGGRGGGRGRGFNNRRGAGRGGGSRNQGDRGGGSSWGSSNTDAWQSSKGDSWGTSTTNNSSSTWGASSSNDAWGTSKNAPEDSSASKGTSGWGDSKDNNESAGGWGSNTANSSNKLNSWDSSAGDSKPQESSSTWDSKTQESSSKVAQGPASDWGFKGGNSGLSWGEANNDDRGVKNDSKQLGSDGGVVENSTWGGSESKAGQVSAWNAEGAGVKSSWGEQEPAWGQGKETAKSDSKNEGGLSASWGTADASSKNTGQWGQDTEQEKPKSWGAVESTNSGGDNKEWGSSTEKSGWGNANSAENNKPTWGANSNSGGGAWGGSSSSAGGGWNSNSGGGAWGGSSNSGGGAWGDSSNSGAGGAWGGSSNSGGGGWGGSSNSGGRDRQSNGSRGNFGGGRRGDRGRGGGPRNGGERSNACFRCGNEGHKSAECTEKDKRPPLACFNCGGPHKKQDCPNPQTERPKEQYCSICKKTGHFYKTCPDFSADRQNKGDFSRRRSRSRSRSKEGSRSSRPVKNDSWGSSTEGSGWENKGGRDAWNNKSEDRWEANKSENKNIWGDNKDSKDNSKSAWGDNNNSWGEKSGTGDSGWGDKQAVKEDSQGEKKSTWGSKEDDSLKNRQTKSPSDSLWGKVLPLKPVESRNYEIDIQYRDSERQNAPKESQNVWETPGNEWNSQN